MKNKLHPFLLLVASILTLSSCKTADSELELMSKEEINNFVTNFQTKYQEENYTYNQHASELFKSTRSGIINLSQEVNEENNKNSTKYLTTASIEFDLDKNYMCSNYTRSDTINNQEQIETIESIYLKENSTIKEYRSSNNNKYVHVLKGEILPILYNCIREYTGGLLDYSLLKINEFNELYSSNSLNIYKNEDIYLTDFEYTDETHALYTNKITYNKEYLPIDSTLIVNANFQVPNSTDTNKFYNKSELKIKPGAVKVKSFDKNQYLEMPKVEL